MGGATAPRVPNTARRARVGGPREACARRPEAAPATPVTRPVGSIPWAPAGVVAGVAAARVGGARAAVARAAKAHPAGGPLGAAAAAARVGATSGPRLRRPLPRPAAIRTRASAGAPARAPRAPAMVVPSAPAAASLVRAGEGGRAARLGRPEGGQARRGPVGANNPARRA